MRNIKLFAGALLILIATTSFAGVFASIEVEIVDNGDGSGSAFGAMPITRHSEDEVAYIGCGTRNIDTGGGSLFTFAFCQAGDADGNEAFCSTQNPALVESIRAIADTSFVIFAWTTSGECRQIGLSTQSLHQLTNKETKK